MPFSVQMLGGTRFDNCSRDIVDDCRRLECCELLTEAENIFIASEVPAGELCV